jgi:hypothetical protein
LNRPALPAGEITGSFFSLQWVLVASSQKQHPGRPGQRTAGVLNRASSFMLDATILGRKN